MISKVSWINLFQQHIIDWMENNVDTDQLASAEASWSGSTLFSKVDNIQDQHENGLSIVLYHYKYT